MCPFIEKVPTTGKEEGTSVTVLRIRIRDQEPF
jgi:hypothetical protein